MAIDVTFTSGVIASREKFFLKEKLLRMCETGAEEAFRALVESGYGAGETAANVYEYEKLVEAEEKALDEFICEYAPSDSELAYFLAPRDFHNAKALLKAAYLATPAEKMLAPEGEIGLKTLEEAVKSGDFSFLSGKNDELKEACEKVTEAFQEEGVSGSFVGEVFEKATYAHLFKRCKRKGGLKKFLLAKADMQNILTAFRSENEREAEGKFLPFGTLKTEALLSLFGDEETVEKAFSGSSYSDFVKKCLAARKRGKPPVEAERALASFETDFFREKRYELEKTEPFLYYVFRRRAENANVRIVFVCLLAGLKEQEIKKRLRAI